MKQVDSRRLVFLDEAAANTKMGRSHAWIKRGTELVDPRPMNWGKSLTMIGAVRTTGWVALGTMFKTANSDRFVRWFSKGLLPHLFRGDIVVLDNAQAHKDPRIVALARRQGVRIKLLPPYSPDFNPIEPAWALVKKHIKRIAPRTDGALRRVAHQARRRVTRAHCVAWSRHAGYAVNSTDRKD
jgi:transposase